MVLCCFPMRINTSYLASMEEGFFPSSFPTMCIIMLFYFCWLNRWGMMSCYYFMLYLLDVPQGKASFHFYYKIWIFFFTIFAQFLFLNSFCCFLFYSGFLFMIVMSPLFIYIAWFFFLRGLILCCNDLFVSRLKEEFLDSSDVLSMKKIVVTLSEYVIFNCI